MEPYITLQRFLKIDEFCDVDCAKTEFWNNKDWNDSKMSPLWCKLEVAIKHSFNNLFLVYLIAFWIIAV